MQVTLLQPCLLSATVQCSALGLMVPPLSQMKLLLFWAQVVHGGDLSAGKKWLQPQLLLSKAMLSGSKALSLAVLISLVGWVPVPGTCSPWFCSSTTHTFNMLFLSAGRVGLSKTLMMENKLESERNNL